MRCMRRIEECHFPLLTCFFGRFIFNFWITLWCFGFTPDCVRGSLLVGLGRLSGSARDQTGGINQVEGKCSTCYCSGPLGLFFHYEFLKQDAFFKPETFNLFDVVNML